MIAFKNVSKSFKDNLVIDGLNLKVEKGEFVVLIGQSGCGKTTTMKMINRLIEPTEGQIFIDGKDIAKINPIELRRNIGYVIQMVGLFPHMTVGENIEIVPMLKNWDDKKRQSRSRELLDLVGLPAKEYYSRYPHELSGGQKQRIGIARALAVNPDVILMDEPFSALDPITREQLQDELLRLQEELGKTIVLVSHDIDEAIKLADKIAVMSDGEVIQFDTPENILTNPVNEFVENFIGKDRLWKTPELLLTKDIMIKDYPKSRVTRTKAQAIEFMKEKRSEFLIVVDKEDRYEGYLTMAQIMKKTESNYVKDIKKNDIEVINEDMNMVEVINLMKSRDIRFVPIVDSRNKVKGVITKSSLLTIISDLIVV